MALYQEEHKNFNQVNSRIKGISIMPAKIFLLLNFCLEVKILYEGMRQATKNCSF
jgi:hypothetical protein